MRKRAGAFILLLVGTAWGQAFRPKSALPSPLREIAEDQEIDQACQMNGDADPEQDSKRAAQNRAKNNFYAPGPVVTVGLNTFRGLQRAADSRGIHGLPEDRSVLENIFDDRGVQLGEGAVVRFVAFILSAKHSGAESVNCKLTGRRNNDIHVNLVRKPGDRPCNSITAEIGPHFRPEAWHQIVQYTKQNRFQGRPLRFTGQLFFDGHHAPCRPGKQASPERVSSWEIHPIYAIDVCRRTTLSGCRAGDEDVWTPLHQWMEAGPEEGEEP